MIIGFIFTVVFCVAAYLFRPLKFKICFLTLAGYALLLLFDVDFYSSHHLFRLTSIPLILVTGCFIDHFRRD